MSSKTTINVDPDSIHHFGESGESNFYLISNAEISDSFKLGSSKRYKQAKIIGLKSDEKLECVISDQTSEPAHIFVISPNRFLVSPDPTSLGKRKLIVLPCASTPTSMADIQQLIKTIVLSDYQLELSFIDRFFSLGRSSKKLIFTNDKYATQAHFNHQHDEYEWNIQAGPLDWGEQQIAPSGELSVTPGGIMDFDPSLSLDINGEIAIEGPLAIHSGTPSFEESDRTSLHSRLAVAEKHPIIVSVKNGRIIKIRASHPDGEIAALALRDLIDIDSRYAILWECGFGINSKHSLLTGNVGMNEPYGGKDGCSHWGIGLTPHTQYALIFICRGTSVSGKDGSLLIKSDLSTADSSAGGGGMKNVQKSACPCYTS